MSRSQTTINRKTTIRSRDSHPIFEPGERRSRNRAQVTKGMELDAEVRCGFDMVWPGRAVNLSLQGIMLEFPKTNVPSLRVDEKVSVKLRCHEDVVWVAGVVRHRHGKRIGIFFSHLLDQGMRSTEHALSRILKAVERGWLRQHLCAK